MTGRRNRRESFQKSKPKFTEQEHQVLMQLNMGLNDAWSISNKTGMLITSVRRSLTDLVSKGAIAEIGTTFNPETQRNVTTYRTLSVKELETNQIPMI